MLTRLTRQLSIALLLLLALVPVIKGQDCSPPAITANTKNYNIFSPEQEMILGDLTFQRMSGELRFIRDQELEAYLNALGEKLVKHLPPTGLNYQFHIVDIPEANAFNIPGGYVFVSRKLIGFVKSEDELVGVLAHELGHAAVRHSANDFSNYLKQVLNVTQVGDKKDITEKYNLLIERQRTKELPRSKDHESAQQLEADRIGVFAMVAAGFDPNAFTGFFDRLAETKGKTGSWFSDIFGKVKPEQKRLREMIKVTDQLPATCRENRQSTASQTFLNWQAEVVTFREKSRAEQLSGLLWKKNLNPGLRSDLSHFAFSPDGAHIIAQDDFAITVLKREPLEVLFQISESEALDATFTPDSKFIVFGTESLRYEKWSVEDQRPVEVRELVVRRDCWEYEFSPDGKFLSCVDFDMNLNVLDTQTGKRVWEKKQIYQLTDFEIMLWAINSILTSNSRVNRFFHIVYSPDSHYLTVARSHMFRFSFTYNAMMIGQSENTFIALDLQTLKPVSVPGEMKKITKRPYVFLDSNRILAMSSEKIDESGIFSFPEAKRQAKFPFWAMEVTRSADPNYVILKPLSNARLGIYDVSRNKIINGMNKVDAAVWKDQILYEGLAGQLVLAEFGYDDETKRTVIGESKSIDIPAESIGRLNVAEVSDNFQWLVMSSKTRGGVWNLASGDRKLFVRGFKGAVIGNDGGGIGEFPKLADVNHALVLMNPLASTVDVIRDLPEVGATQHGRFVLIREPLPDPKKSNDKKKKEEEDQDSNSKAAASESELRSNVRMLLRDVVKDNVVWQRDFTGPAPRYFFDKFSGRLIFYWTLGSSAGKDRLKADPALNARAQKMGNRDDDYLLEIVDAFAAKTVGTVLIETGKGSFDIESANSEGNWLVIRDSTNRILSFTLDDGELKHRFFGSFATINPKVNEVVVENYPGELSIYNLASGEREARLVVGSEVVFLRFSLDGKRLFVLTDRQVAYAFDVDKVVAKPVPSGVD